MRRSVAPVLLVVAVGASVPAGSAAQVVSPSDREALVRLRVSQGGIAEEVDALLRHADDAAGKGLPVAPLTNKIREGLAKGAAPGRIDAVVARLALDLATADRVLRELQPAPTGTEGEMPVLLLAEAIGAGVTPEEIHVLARQADSPEEPLSAGGLGGAAKGLSFIKEAGLALDAGTGVMAEAAKRGFPTHQIIALGREIRRRERDYRDGPESLLALREAIARGERPDQLFRDARPFHIERPAPTRPTDARPAPVDRAQRPARPDRPAGHDRPEPPVRPNAPGR